MRALQLTGWGRAPELRAVPVPAPGPGQMVVKVAAAGACHSDLQLMEYPVERVRTTTRVAYGPLRRGEIEGRAAVVPE